MWCIPAAVAEVVPVGSETSWAPLPELPELPDPEPWSRVRTNRQPARRQTGKPITDFADSLNGDLLYFQISQSFIILVSDQPAGKLYVRYVFFWQRYAWLLLGFFDLDWIIGPTWTQPR